MASVSQEKPALAVNAVQSHSEHKPPVITVTQYDKVAAGLIAIVVGLGLTVLALSVLWATNRPAPRMEAVPVELIELPGGSLDGTPDETLKVESPADVSDDPSVSENEQETEIVEMKEVVLELSDQMAEIASEQYETEVEDSGKAGSATGTGRQALGMGDGVSGLPREQRWYVRFSDQGSLNQYASQLDFFGIELGALLPSGEIVYVSNLAASSPTKRVTKSGKNEQRLYFTWNGGQRRQADFKLFQKVGVNASGAIIFHFYPKNTENLLAQLELKYANRKYDEIRRTYFVVRSNGRGYEFVVTRQTYLY